MNELKAVLHKTRLMLEMVKFEHTIFALPFACISVLLAARTQGHVLPSAHIVFWILVAMVTARSAAMAFNRIVDAKYDISNPRTASRHIPAGILSQSQVIVFLACAIAVFETSAWEINKLCFALSPVALAFLLGYSYTKRFTSLCHVFLGFAIGIAPIGAWLAVCGSWALTPILLGAAVMCWIGGFDIIYALQDYENDVKSVLFSLPKRVGKARALNVSRAMHVLMMALLLAVGIINGLHLWYFVGVAVVCGLIAYEQSLVKPDDLRHINLAFFTLNGWVSICLFGFVILDRLFSR